MDKQTGSMKPTQPGEPLPGQLEEWLAFSLDQPLQEEQDRALASAMRDNPALQAEKIALLQLRSQLASWKPPKKPDFMSQLRKKLEKQRRHALVFYFFPRVAVASILLAMGIALLSGYFSKHLSDKVALGVDYLEPDDAYGFISTE